MRGKAIPDEVRVKIAADLTAGHTRKEVAARYGVSESAVAKYSPLAKSGTVYRARLVSVNQLGERYLELIDRNFDALAAIAGQATDREWLAKQSAGEVATLYGVIFDKTGKLAGAALASAGLLPGSLSGDEASDGAAPDA